MTFPPAAPSSQYRLAKCFQAASHRLHIATDCSLLADLDMTSLLGPILVALEGQAHSYMHSGNVGAMIK
jgi:hypothetical protein